jgi:hypothetical protein
MKAAETRRLMLASSRAALLDQACGPRVEVHPGHGARGAPVDAAHRRAVGPQRGDVDAHAATSGHDLDHLAERIDDALTRVLGIRHDIAVEQRQRHPGAGARPHAPSGNQAQGGDLLGEGRRVLRSVRRLDLRDGGGNALRHLAHRAFDRPVAAEPRHLQRVRRGLSSEQRQAEALAVHLLDPRDLLLGPFGIVVGLHDRHIADLESALQILTRVSVEEDLPRQVVVQAAVSRAVCHRLHWPRSPLPHLCPPRRGCHPRLPYPVMQALSTKPSETNE